MAKLSPRAMRIVRHARIRKSLSGTSVRPRLNVFRSLNHVYAQIIDDSQGRTLLSVSTLSTEVRDKEGKKAKVKQAEVVGTMLAQRAMAMGINKVVFDRGGYRYHGRVKALAEAARKEGLLF